MGGINKMPCRVGITTNLAERKAYWENRVAGLTNWRILASYRSKERAQDHENSYAERYNCRAHAGGSDAPGTWYVYRFNYTRERS